MSTLGRAGEPAAVQGSAPCPLCRPFYLGLDVSRELLASERAREGAAAAAGRRAAGGGEGEEARRGREEGKQGGREGGEEDPESARQLEFLQRLAGLQCTAAASRGGSRQPGSSGGGRASGGPAPCPCKLCEQPARGAGGAPRRLGLDHGRALGRRSASRRRRCYHRSSAPPRGAAGGSRGPQPRPLGTARLVPGQG